MMLKVLLVALAATAAAGQDNFRARTQLPNIIRPCQLRDYRCIREYFAANSQCIPQNLDKGPELIYVRSARFETPFFNASYVDNNLIVKGQDRCFVSEFFLNGKTRGGVLGIDCPYLTFESNRTLFQHKSLGEDDVYHYNICGTYPLIRLTMTLSDANRPNICNEFTFADVTELPFFDINPNDMATRNFLSRDLTMLNIFERETFLYRANMLVRNFINTVICKFNC